MQVERILILPGMDGTGKLLLEFMRALPAAIRTEVPVYGRDVVLLYDQLVKLIRRLGEDSPPFAIVAESFSTPLAIRIAAENPENLKGLILCAGFASSPARELKRLLASALAPLVMRGALPEGAIRRWLLGRDAPASMVVAAREAVGSVKPAVLSARLREVLACDVREDLRKVEVPILYLQARQDRLVPARCLEEIRRIRPETRFEIIDGPHFLLQREPHKTAEIVTEYLAGLP